MSIKYLFILTVISFLHHRLCSSKDINECTLKIDKCDKQTSYCENIVNSYRCVCKEGFQHASTNKLICEDINECLGINKCYTPSTKCVNTFGSYHCKCSVGYFNKSRSPDMCEDFNECHYKKPCDPTTTSECINTEGSYYCQCKDRFMKSQKNIDKCEDINECLMGHGCDPISTHCVNSFGGYQCLCRTGFKPYSELDCQDIDECSLKDVNKCDLETTECRNTPGSYYCTCVKGFTNINDAGFTCEDLDECQTVENVCDVKSTSCVNTYGSFHCKCNPGFENITKSFHICQDVDECATKTDKCDRTSTSCVNTAGSYVCRCKPGFHEMKNGQTCVDIDECRGSIVFCDHVTSSCMNTPGSYKCVCATGYVLKVDSAVECEDVDECKSLTAPCDSSQSVCINTIGSYYCRCLPTAHPQATCVREPDRDLGTSADYVLIFCCIAVAILLQIIGCLAYWYCTKKKQAAHEKRLLKKEIQEEEKLLSAPKHGESQSEDEETLAEKEEERKKRKLKKERAMEDYTVKGVEKLLDSDAKRWKKELKALHKVKHEFKPLQKVILDNKIKMVQKEKNKSFLKRQGLPISLKSSSGSTISDLSSGSTLFSSSNGSSSASEISSPTSSMSDSSSVVMQKVADKLDKKKVKEIIKNQNLVGSYPLKVNNELDRLPKPLQTSESKKVVQPAPTLKPSKEITDSKLEQSRKKLSSKLDQAKMKLVSEKNLERKDTKDADKSLKIITPINLSAQNLHQEKSQVSKTFEKKPGLAGDTKVPQIESDGFKTGIVMKTPIEPPNVKIKQTESDRYKTRMIFKSPDKSTSQIVLHVDSAEFDAKNLDRSKEKTSIDSKKYSEDVHFKLSLRDSNLRRRRRKRRRASSPSSSQISTSSAFSSIKPEQNFGYVTENSFRDSVTSLISKDNSEIPLIGRSDDSKSRIISESLSKSGTKQFSILLSSSAEPSNTGLKSFTDSRTNTESTGTKSLTSNEFRRGMTMNNRNKLPDGGFTSLNAVKKVDKSLNIGFKHNNNRSKNNGTRYFNLTKKRKFVNKSQILKNTSKNPHLNKLSQPADVNHSPSVYRTNTSFVSKPAIINLSKTRAGDGIGGFISATFANTKFPPNKIMVSKRSEANINVNCYIPLAQTSTEKNFLPTARSIKSNFLLLTEDISKTNFNANESKNRSDGNKPTSIRVETEL